MVEDNESPHDGVRCELAEELQLDLTPQTPLIVEWVGAHGPAQMHGCPRSDG